MDKSEINAELARRLIATQFPQWRDLRIDPVELGGWDNRTFHLGSDMLVRMPSAKDYEPQVEKEHLWLPKLAPRLPLEIPQSIALGMPGEGYPWKMVSQALDRRNSSLQCRNTKPRGVRRSLSTILACFAFH